MSPKKSSLKNSWNMQSTLSTTRSFLLHMIKRVCNLLPDIKEDIEPTMSKRHTFYSWWNFISLDSIRSKCWYIRPWRYCSGRYNIRHEENRRMWVYTKSFETTHTITEAYTCGQLYVRCEGSYVRLEQPEHWKNVENKKGWNNEPQHRTTNRSYTWKQWVN